MEQVALEPGGRGLCECGCGGKTGVPDKTDRKRGRVKGRPMRFLPGHNIDMPGQRRFRRYPLPVVGQRFGRLVVLEAPEKSSKVAVRCDCGVDRVVATSSLHRGLKSCGCLARERREGPNHAKRKTPEWRSWKSMKNRCLNPNAHNYSWYGGRGIGICDRWRWSFEAFLEDMGGRPDGMSLDRIDVNGDYGPDNCRWATPKEQRANQRRRASGLRIAWWDDLEFGRVA